MDTWAEGLEGRFVGPVVDHVVGGECLECGRFGTAPPKQKGYSVRKSVDGELSRPLVSNPSQWPSQNHVGHFEKAFNSAGGLPNLVSPLLISKSITN